MAFLSQTTLSTWRLPRCLMTIILLFLAVSNVFPMILFREIYNDYSWAVLCPTCSAPRSVSSSRSPFVRMARIHTFKFPVLYTYFMITFILIASSPSSARNVESTRVEFVLSLPQLRQVRENYAFLNLLKRFPKVLE